VYNNLSDYYIYEPSKIISSDIKIGEKVIESKDKDFENTISFMIVTIGFSIVF